MQTVTKHCTLKCMLFNRNQRTRAATCFKFYGKATTLQRNVGRVPTVNAYEKLVAFKDKLLLWIKHIEKGNLVNFLWLNEAVIGNNAVQFNCLEIVRHLYMFSTSFEGYFSSRELQSVDSWIRNPFLFKLKAMDNESDLVDELIDLKNN